MTSITGQLADFCVGLRTRSVPDPVLDHTAAVLLDWLGAALAGASSQSAALTRQLEPLLGGPCEASLVGCAQRASICLAALHNGTSSSVHELDDVHRDAAIHPGVVVIPAALAVGSRWRAAKPQGQPLSRTGYRCLSSCRRLKAPLPSQCLPQGPPEALPSPILRRLSSTKRSTALRRVAAARWRARDWGGGAKRVFVLPTRHASRAILGLL